MKAAFRAASLFWASSCNRTETSVGRSFSVMVATSDAHGPVAEGSLPAGSVVAPAVEPAGLGAELDPPRNTRKYSSVNSTRPASKALPMMSANRVPLDPDFGCSSPDSRRIAVSCWP